MDVRTTALEGLFEIRLDRKEDGRGYFARSWDPVAAQAAGIDVAPDQWSFSFNNQKATLRGMHWQTDPFAETKLVRCVQGAVWDVAVDLREDSATFLQWFGVELTDKDLNGLYIPPGFAHGFITCTDNALVQYGLQGEYAPDHAGGARWNDPAFKISWPLEPGVISERDRTYPDFQISVDD